MTNPFLDLINQNKPIIQEYSQDVPDPSGLDKFKSIIQRLGESQQSNPQMQQLQQTLGQFPERQHIPWYRKLGSIPAGVTYGPQAQQEYLNQPYQQKFTDWANKVGAEEKGLTLPYEIQSLQNKPLLDYLKAQGDLTTQDKNRAEAELARARVGGIETPEQKMEAARQLEAQRIQGSKDVEEMRLSKGANENEKERQADTVIKAHNWPNDEKHRLMAYRELAQLDYHPEDKSFQKGIEEERLALGERDKGSTNIDKLETPITQDASRIARLDDMLTHGTQATDPIIAPELLQVITQGKGRMSEAEISRIMGGPDALTKFNRFIDQWTSDPNKRFNMQPETQQQISKLVGVMRKRNDLKIQAIDDARANLESTTSPMKVLSVTNKLKKRLGEIDQQEVKPNVQGTISWSKYHSAHPEISREDFNEAVKAKGQKVSE